MKTQPPVVLLVYANDRVDEERHLRDLVAEIHDIRQALQPPGSKDRCQVEVLDHATAAQLTTALQLEDYRNRIAVLHFSGHAGEDLFSTLAIFAAGRRPRT